jgi:hypothetical protein
MESASRYRNRRLWASLIPIGLFAGALGGAAITPVGFFKDPIYWTAVLWFGVVGGVLLGNTSRVSKIPRYTSVTLSFFVAFLVLASRMYPEAGTILYGLVGLFIGFGVRISSFLYFETKWMYCDVCKRDYWHMKHNGVWECQRAVHSYIHN